MALAEGLNPMFGAYLALQRLAAEEREIDRLVDEWRDREALEGLEPLPEPVLREVMRTARDVLSCERRLRAAPRVVFVASR
jgi:hypothetical protein